MYERIIDINGNIIVLPEYYYETLERAREMIDKMEEKGVDRSDMHVILNSLINEMKFHLDFLKDRQ